MPGLLLTVTAQITCPHGGKVTILPPVAKVLAGAQPVATMSHQYVVAGCANLPLPCTMVQWAPPALKVLVGGVPAVLATSIGTCMAGGAPAGPAIVVPGQFVAIGT